MENNLYLKDFIVCDYCFGIIKKRHATKCTTCKTKNRDKNKNKPLNWICDFCCYSICKKHSKKKTFLCFR